MYNKWLNKNYIHEKILYIDVDAHSMLLFTGIVILLFCDGYIHLLVCSILYQLMKFVIYYKKLWF